MSHESLDQPESGSKRAPSGANETNYDLILISQLAGCHPPRGARYRMFCRGGGKAQNTGACRELVIRNQNNDCYEILHRLTRRLIKYRIRRAFLSTTSHIKQSLF